MLTFTIWYASRVRVFHQCRLCPALIVTEPKLPILVVAPGVHCT